MVGERFLSQHEGGGGGLSRANIPGVTSDPGRGLSESSLELRGFIHVWPFFFQAHEADAVMVDGGLVYEAGLKPYNLKPVVAEFYGSKDGASLMGTQVSVLTQLLWRDIFKFTSHLSIHPLSHPQTPPGAFPTPLPAP